MSSGAPQHTVAAIHFQRSGSQAGVAHPGFSACQRSHRAVYHDNYMKPSWSDLQAMPGTNAFITNRQLWGDLNKTYPEFAESLRHEIIEMESKWPV